MSGRAVIAAAMAWIRPIHPTAVPEVNTTEPPGSSADAASSDGPNTVEPAAERRPSTSYSLIGW